MLYSLIAALAISPPSNGNALGQAAAAVMAPRDFVKVGMTREQVETLLPPDPLFSDGGRVMINKGAYHVWYSRLRLDVVYLDGTYHGGKDRVRQIIQK